MGVALESLTNLYLEFNKLSDLPNDLSKLQNLQTLHLDSNNFSIIPTTIYKIFKLRCLKMSRNLIDSVSKGKQKLNFAASAIIFLIFLRYL
jgi:Leucine-rich repeat (LRR) protein